MNNRHYGNAIWTNHALSRLGQRGLSQEMAWQTFRYPDHSSSGKTPGSMEYKKKFTTSTVTVIAKQNDKKEWVILSCWIEPPLIGTKDAKQKEGYKKFQNASVWGKWWYAIKQQLFG